MAAGPGIVLNKTLIDTTPCWQLLKTPSVNQTAVTAAKLCQAFEDVSFAQDTFEVIDVSMIRTLALQVWGVASDNNTFTLELYAWPESGPGRHFQQVTGVLSGAVVSTASVGFHQAARTHRTIKAVFDPLTTYIGADTYVAVTTVECYALSFEGFNEVRIQADPETDFPAELLVDFDTIRPRYFGVAVTAQTGTSLGAIFKPLRRWGPST